MYVVEQFRRWWNSLASKNGKVPFRTAEDAAEFVHKVLRETGGPNEMIQAMRERYEQVKRARAHKNNTRFNAGGDSPVFK